MATRMKLKAKRSIKNDDKSSEKSADELDTAVLSKPVITSINNLSKIIKLYQNTTEEIRQYLTAECDILYECRVCRNIFRSLSNFILHKRKYCQEKFSYVTYSKWFNNDDDYLDIIQKETHCHSESETNKEEETKLPKKNLSSIIDNLTQKKQVDLEIQQMLSSEHKENQEIDIKPSKMLGLERIEGSNCGVFQTMSVDDISKNKEETIKLEVMEMYRFTEGQTAVLGPDGKVTNQKPVSGLKILDSNENTSLRCPKCNVHFSTRKTLLSHIKYKHESERIVYPCLECSETFATVWSVYRHLYNIHHKTLAEVRKMRSRIKAKCIKIEASTNDDQINMSLNDQQKIDEENQEWMDNFESDNDIQMCGGCGRRFERKAALNSHSQTCQKRIAAQNMININKQKRIAALEEKSGEKKKPQKMIRLDQEMEKNYLDKQKINVAKKRKIGIQIRYDYTKSTDKNNSSQMISANISESNDFRKKSETLSNNQPNDVNTVDITCTKNSFEVDKISRLTLETDLDPEIVSIPSSNSSPNKDDHDPLDLNDTQNDSDCEIEEIQGPIEHSIFGSQTSNLFEIAKDGRTEDEESNQYKAININENTLKLIKMINSDIPAENLKPTLDTKMASYVNMKRLKCIPCDAKFGNISKLRHHMASHFNWNRFRCDICTFKAYDKIEVFEHVKQEHNILEFEKIEAIILQIPDWETAEISSDVFLPTKEIKITQIIKKPDDERKNEKRERESLHNESPDNCIIIEPNDLEEKPIVGKPNVPPLKQKKKAIKLSDVEHVTADTVPRDVSDNHSDEVQSENRSSSHDPELKKMVYEVIFGQDITVTRASVSNNVSGEEKDSIHVVPKDVSNVISRPVRNRVKPMLYKDFVYDLHGFKEDQKTVLVSNSNRKIIPLENKISDSLEDLHSIEKTNKKSFKNTNKNNFGTTDNSDKNLNLQKRAIENLADNEILKDGFPQNIKTVDSNSIVTESNSIQSDGEDDDIYIIENEELVAIK